MTDFPDRNLDHLHRAASGRPRRPEPYPIDAVIVLPREPQRDVVIEALNAGGGMVVAWRYGGRDWVPFAGAGLGRPEDWASIVEAAIRNRWTLMVRKQGSEPTPEQPREAGR